MMDCAVVDCSSLAIIIIIVVINVITAMMYLHRSTNDFRQYFIVETLALQTDRKRQKSSINLAALYYIYLLHVYIVLCRFCIVCTFVRS